MFNARPTPAPDLKTPPNRPKIASANQASARKSLYEMIQTDLRACRHLYSHLGVAEITLVGSRGPKTAYLTDFQPRQGRASPKSGGEGGGTRQVPEVKMAKIDQKLKVAPNHPKFVSANSGWHNLDQNASFLPFWPLVPYASPSPRSSLMGRYLATGRHYRPQNRPKNPDSTKKLEEEVQGNEYRKSDWVRRETRPPETCCEPRRLHSTPPLSTWKYPQIDQKSPVRTKPLHENRSTK